MGFKDFFKPQWQHSKPEVRKSAIAELFDQKILLEIMKYEKDYDVRQVAVSNISDINILLNFLNDEGNKNVRQAINDSITNKLIKYLEDSSDLPIEDNLVRGAEVQNSLKKILINQDLDHNVRYRASTKINDQKFINANVIDLNDSTIQDYLLWNKVNDEEVFKQFLFSDHSYALKRSAILGVNDKTCLLKVIQTTDSPALKRIACENLAKHHGVRSEIKKLQKQFKYDSVLYDAFDNFPKNWDREFYGIDMFFLDRIKAKPDLKISKYAVSEEGKKLSEEFTRQLCVPDELKILEMESGYKRSKHSIKEPIKSERVITNGVLSELILRMAKEATELKKEIESQTVGLGHCGYGDIGYESLKKFINKVSSHSCGTDVIAHLMIMKWAAIPEVRLLLLHSLKHIILNFNKDIHFKDKLILQLFLGVENLFLKLWSKTKEGETISTYKMRDFALEYLFEL